MLPDSLWILTIDNFGTFFEWIKTKKSGSILRKQWFVIKKVDLASLEFVHLPHPLSRDVFALIQFHIRLKSFQKYLVKWQQCESSDAISERIWPFIVNKYHYSLRFVPTFKKKAYGILRDDFFSLILSRKLLLCARVHATSIWNFTIQWTSHDDLTEKSADIFHFKHQTKNSLNDRKSKLHFAIWRKNCTKVRSS